MNSFGTLFHDKIFSLTIPWLLTTSLTCFKFPDISKFSRQVVTVKFLWLVLHWVCSCRRWTWTEGRVKWVQSAASLRWTCWCISLTITPTIHHRASCFIVKPASMTPRSQSLSKSVHLCHFGEIHVWVYTVFQWHGVRFFLYFFLVHCDQSISVVVFFFEFLILLI